MNEDGVIITDLKNNKKIFLTSFEVDALKEVVSWTLTAEQHNFPSRPHPYMSALRALAGKFNIEPKHFSDDR